MKIKKLNVDNFDPSKSTDAQLAEDLRLLAANFANLKAGKKTEFKDQEEIVELMKTLLKEIYKRGKLTFSPERMKPTSFELLQIASTAIVKDEIIIDKASALSDGTLTIHLSKKQFDFTDPKLLMSEEAKGPLGIIRFDKGEKINLIDFEELEKEHGFNNEQRINKFGVAKKFFAHKVRDFIPFGAIQKTHVAKNDYDETYFESQKTITGDFIIELGEIIKSIEGTSILEIGVGTGKALKILKDSGYDVKGIDHSPIAVNLCKKKELPVVECKADELDLESNSYDTVFSMRTMGDVGNIDEAINESVRVAKNMVIHILPIGESSDLTHKHVFLKIDTVKKIFKNIPFLKTFDRLPTGSIIVEINKSIKDEVGIVVDDSDKQDADDSGSNKEIDISKEFKVYKKDAEKRIIYGVIYVPNEVDAHGDEASAEEIEKAAHGFLTELILQQKDKAGININHETGDVGDNVKIVESYISPTSFTAENGDFIKKGTWIIATHIANKSIWKMIQDGKINAFSMEGTATGA